MMWGRNFLAALGAAAALALASPSWADEPLQLPDNALHVKIDSGNTHTTRALHLSLNKAAIVELPVDARDALVSNPKIADAVIRTPRRIYVMGLEVGQTNAFFFDQGGQQVLNLEITVERDYGILAQMYKRLMPTSRIDVQALNDNIVLSGTVDDPASADQARDLAARFVGDDKHVVSMLNVKSSQQVLLKVRIAEMQRTLAKQLGVNLNSAFSVGEVTAALKTVNPYSIVGQALTSSALTGSYAKNGNSVDTTIQALERDGLMRTLAEPNLTAISGESAKFLAGGEFPVPVSSDQNGNVSLQFKPFGVGLGFTPVVMGGGRISLKISTEVSETTAENAFTASARTVVTNGNTVTLPGLTVPGLNVRRAETTVELPSGGSLVMAGLLQDTLRQNIDGIPGLKDVPVLGALFRSRDFQNNETELVVMVTPYLVKPTEEKKIALPTDGFSPASDLDTALRGRPNSVYAKPSVFGGQAGIQGPVGFVMK
ncbi:MAG: type II and III secretion system protein family protein [Alphaproteobacteria bacterium]